MFSNENETSVMMRSVLMQDTTNHVTKAKLYERGIEVERKIISNEEFEQALQIAIHKGYITEDGCPQICGNCGSHNLESVTMDRINHTVCEVKVVCADCGDTCGHWAYGSYNPNELNIWGLVLSEPKH